MDPKYSVIKGLLFKYENLLYLQSRWNFLNKLLENDDFMAIYL